MWPLLKTGYRRDLKQEDVFRHHADDESAKLGERLQE